MIEVYTSIFGGYDKQRNDIKNFVANGRDKFKENVMNAKIYKILAHKFIKADYSIWIDGNIFLNVDKEKIIDLLGDNDIAVFKHPVRNCLFEEYTEARKRLPEWAYGDIDEQARDYQNDGMPKDFGLGECGMIIRKHNAIVEEFNEKWWAEVSRYSWRDQMSFPYVWWKMKDKIKIKLLDSNVREHEYFRYIYH